VRVCVVKGSTLKLSINSKTVIRVGVLCWITYTRKSEALEIERAIGEG
jgi:hypothetical protein